MIAVEKPGKDPSLAANYRSVALLSVCYKLLERLALQRISPTVEGLLYAKERSKGALQYNVKRGNKQHTEHI